MMSIDSWESQLAVLTPSSGPRAGQRVTLTGLGPALGGKWCAYMYDGTLPVDFVRLWDRLCTTDRLSLPAIPRYMVAHTFRHGTPTARA